MSISPMRGWIIGSRMARASAGPERFRHRLFSIKACGFVPRKTAISTRP